MSNRRPVRPVSLLSAIIVLLGGSHALAATTWWVTNNGTDSGACGGRGTPCRSISQAIENASAGDTIMIGAGRYGNVSGDGTFTHAGDEHPQVLPTAPFASDDQPKGCIICITKPLRILSIHGQSVTVIEGAPNETYPNTVVIASDGVTFGGPGAGFTVMGGNGSGIALLQAVLVHAVPAGQGVVIADNKDIGDGTGFNLRGRNFQDRQCPVPEACPPIPVQILNNEAVDNPGAGFGLEINAWDSSAPIIVRGNTARNGGTGFSVDPGGQTEEGNSVSAGPVALTGNVSLHNIVGFYANSPGSMINNTAAGNQQVGFSVVPAGGAFQGNSAIGNGGPGMVVQYSTDGFDDANSQQKVFHPFGSNNFYANDRHRPAGFVINVRSANFGPLDPGPSAHCGVLNVGAVGASYGPGQDYPIGQGPPERLDVSGSFWGSAGGPSSTGPGDAIGGVCDQNGGVTTAKTFAKSDFGITTTGP